MKKINITEKQIKNYEKLVVYQTKVTNREQSLYDKYNNNYMFDGIYLDLLDIFPEIEKAKTTVLAEIIEYIYFNVKPSMAYCKRIINCWDNMLNYI